MRGAVNVLRSAARTRGDIFRVLAEHQLANPEEKGMGFHALYTECRAQLWRRPEVTLRTHLTEFVDHELTRTRKGAGGEDVVHAPFAADAGAAAQGNKHQRFHLSFRGWEDRRSP